MWNEYPVRTDKKIPPIGPNEVSLRAIVTRQKRDGGTRESRYIRITLGRSIASQLGMTIANEEKVMLLIGSDTDRGKVRLVASPTGPFPAKAQPNGNYVITINNKTAEPLFSLDFQPIVLRNVEVIRPENGQPRHCSLHVSAMMLAEGVA